MKKILGPIYLITLILFPFYTFSGGWSLLSFLPMVFLPGIILSIFVLIKFYRNVERGFPWLMSIWITYILGCLFVLDGGDGEAFMGIVTLLSHLTGISEYTLRIYISEFFPIGYLTSLTSPLFVAFLALNILFLVKKMTPPDQSIATNSGQKSITSR